MKPLSIALGAIAVSLIAGQAMAQGISPADKTFATKAAAGGLAEVQMGKLAATNAESPRVKEFGQQMVTDHTQANDELMAIGKQQALTLPTRPDSNDQATAERLSKLKGQAFDTSYMHDMVSDHEKDISDFRREATSGTDPRLKAFAQKYLPTLEQHLQMAKAAVPK